jgi:class 3 adenylate cyclase/CHASE2 domain-containing sensor protein
LKLKPVKLAPALIAVCVIALVCVLHLLHLDFFERLEAITYDMRVREALHFSPPVSTNLGFVSIDDADIAFVKTNRTVGYRFGLYWPRQVYARLVEELAAQKATAVAFDVIFPEMREDQPPVQMADGRLVESDDFFGSQLRHAGNVILAVTKELRLPPVFATNAAALGDINIEKDPDGILRRARAFHTVTNWHWAFRQAAADPDLRIDLDGARIESNHIILTGPNLAPITVPLDSDGNFDLTDLAGDKLPPGVPRKAKPFTTDRIWHLGILLAARHLGLDLAQPDIDLRRGRIVLHSASGPRIIPVDENGYFYINWSIPSTDPRLLQEPIRNLLVQDRNRLDGQTNGLSSAWTGKLAVVGSIATGNDLTDRGATPLERDTFLVSEHWNVANSILTGRFVHRTSLTTDLLLIAALGMLAALFTWYLRVLLASGLVLVSAAAYVTIANIFYIQSHFWLPLIMPIAGGLFMTYVCIVAWRVIFEQAEQRRVKSIFSRIVSPNIVNELLQAEKFSLGGARREVTVLFADVRGFTEFTDSIQEKAEAYVMEHNLAGPEIEDYFNEQARETLATVNTYLSLVADQVKKHEGTLDKYIGDCVMAFWGAPTPNPQHALGCVRAAIDAQRAVYELNQQRATENKSREIENQARTSAGLPPKPMLPTLLLGSGINTGMATVGLMGSEAHLSNYTIFGREVNLASRLETVSGRGRIVISETTYNCLKRDAPSLAATCVALPDATVKGIRVAVKVYEVPWRPPGSAPADPQSSSSSPSITAP